MRGGAARAVAASMGMALSNPEDHALGRACGREERYGRAAVAPAPSDRVSPVPPFRLRDIRTPTAAPVHPPHHPCAHRGIGTCTVTFVLPGPVQPHLPRTGTRA
ncbi:hypothetical protein GCM10010512_09270 [Streptomyces thermoviolaceus subsp. thermoviolaceus]|nr:hypothetical protein GCM10010499_02350 [Streptomyces thermoviolaceus subsp. apingens]GHA80208.1 hypothetical protein GCM10010512_09270 [Streptomyces thermoviolaceus subsp. thermoviolaceus]